MSAPLISVIMPCHNYGRFVGEAISSLQRQTYPHWEVVVVDDGSTDDTRKVLAQLSAADARVKYYYQSQQGVSAARNAAFGLAAGDYIQLLDADDLLAERKFAQQLAVFAEHPEAALVYGDTYVFEHQPTASQYKFKPFTLTMPPLSGVGEALAMQLAYDNIFLISSPLFTRAMLAMVQGFDRSLVAFEDWEFWYRAVLQGCEFVYDNRVGTEFYVRAHGNNTTGNRHKMWKGKIQVREAIMARIAGLLAAGCGAGLGLPAVLRKHQALRHEEVARYQLLYASVLQGALATVRGSLGGEKPWRIWYDSAYWLKERLLGRK